MSVTREQFDAALESLRELQETVERNTADLKIQFERIAQIQAELDANRLATEKRARRKKSAPLPPAIAADEQR